MCDLVNSLTSSSSDHRNLMTKSTLIPSSPSNLNDREVVTINTNKSSPANNKFERMATSRSSMSNSNNNNTNNINNNSQLRASFNSHNKPKQIGN